ncbi:MBL fold metallo-hydrolase [Lacrimispora aerotolerans]|uniref:MBL fold metallo-hydrolase n=1 Tax=Lacrimispora aerotolerans TaxID=36832 RepID=UPI00047BD4BC|nr:MBL fold metallo-hydrolase [Lacrimispora aerotolerans]
MEQLYIFGTGNAAVSNCYNTCFAIKKEDEYFMIDAGGGNGILGILNNMNVELSHIHHLFVSHEHTDHILGVVWMVRFIGTRMKSNQYEGDLTIYCHKRLVSVIDTLCRLTLQGKFYELIGKRIHLTGVDDGETKTILGNQVTFFDIQSTKAEQYGFTTVLQNGKTLTFCGDEPLSSACLPYAKNCDWLLHEAFCLYEERERFKPYEKHHSTVKDACELAQELNAENLILWHTEDSDILHRKERYTKEGAPYYDGRLFVPDDREILPLTP